MQRRRRTTQPTRLPTLSTRARKLLALGVALVAIAAGAVFFQAIVGFYTEQIEVAATPEPHALAVVAARTLQPGVRIEADDLFVMPMPEGMIADQMIHRPEVAIGRYPRERILVNEFLRTERLADPERGDGLSAILPRGMRALSIEISNGEALGDHLEPGSYVDVLATYVDDPALDEPRTHIIEQGLFVLGVNDRTLELTPQQQREVRRAPLPTVTLLVSAEEAERIAFAEQATLLRLALRNNLDDEYAISHGVDVDALLGRLRAAPLPAPRRRVIRPSATESTPQPPEPTIRLIRGSRVDEIPLRSEPTGEDP